MGRTTIDFGIDLGTTNSAVACLRGASIEICKNNTDNDITPSAIYIDKRGHKRIGLLAKNRLGDEVTCNDVCVEFKRLMGTNHRHEFRAAGSSMTPEELSAEVLKACAGMCSSG